MPYIVVTHILGVIHCDVLKATAVTNKFVKEFHTSGLSQDSSDSASYFFIQPNPFPSQATHKFLGWHIQVLRVEAPNPATVFESSHLQWLGYKVARTTILF